MEKLIQFPIRGSKKLKKQLIDLAKNEEQGFSGYCRKVLSNHSNEIIKKNKLR